YLATFSKSCSINIFLSWILQFWSLSTYLTCFTIIFSITNGRSFYIRLLSSSSLYSFHIILLLRVQEWTLKYSQYYLAVHTQLSTLYSYKSTGIQPRCQAK